MTSHSGPAVLATYTRSGFVEGAHHGYVVVVDPHGSVVRSWGNPEHVIFPRSSNKPAQATAMLEAGLDVPEHLVALAASSHSGEQRHLDGVAELLALGGLTADALQTPPDFPLDEQERDAWVRAGSAPAPRAMNCSGKHSGMLVTCAGKGWSIETYREPEHPLQVAVRASVERLAGEPVEHVGVDGCGAPVMSLTMAGLARTLSRAVQAAPGSPERRVADAMRAYPEMVGGSRRDVTAFMRAVPGLVAKDGAEGVYVAALPDGTGIAIKVDDGADRARQVVLASLLVDLGVDPAVLTDLSSVPLHGGGNVVGEVRPALG
ncbi:MAG: asparaginase [Actinomycetes bacterium]